MYERDNPRIPLGFFEGIKHLSEKQRNRRLLSLLKQHYSSLKPTTNYVQKPITIGHQVQGTGAQN